MDALLTRYPTPWTLFYDEEVDPDVQDGGFHVASANGDVLIFCGIYSGDSDVSLSWKEAQELVNFINERSTQGG